MQPRKLLSIFVDIFSAVVGLVFAIFALILVAAIYAPHLLLLRSAGVFLFVVAIAHLLPLAIFKTRGQVISFGIAAVAAAACFSYLDFLAQVDDPDRPYDVESFAKWCFYRSVFLCLFPLIRAFVRWHLLSSTAVYGTAKA